MSIRYTELQTPHILQRRSKRRSKPCKKIHFVQSYKDCTGGVLSLSKSLLGLKAQQDPSLGTGWVGNPGDPQSPREEQVRPNHELPKRSQASRNQGGRQCLHLGQALSTSYPPLSNQPTPVSRGEQGDNSRDEGRSENRELLGLTREVAGSRTPESGREPGRPWSGKTKATAQKGRLWFLRSPLALCGPLIWPGIYLIVALFSREASRNLHEGVKLHTAAVQWPTEPAHCVNTTGHFLVLRVGLGGGWGGTYFARGSLSVGICPVPAAKGCGVSVSAPPAGAASRGVPSPVGGGIIHPDREHDSSTHLRKDNRACRPWLYELCGCCEPFSRGVLPS